jgi:hypothetical protein
MRLREAVVLGAVLAGFAAPTIAQDLSGPKKGDHVTAFDVNDITGPNKGKQLCYV